MSDEIEREEVENQEVVAEKVAPEEVVAEEVVEEVVAEEVAEPSFEEQLKEMTDKYYYVLAEQENARKRFVREKDSLLKYGNEKVLRSLLDVLDNFDRILDALRPDEDEKIKNTLVGMDMVKGQFLSVLNENGMVEVEADGKEFDPNFHEAVGQEDGESENQVLKVLQKGYSLNGRLLRASKVIVSK